MSRRDDGGARSGAQNFVRARAPTSTSSLTAAAHRGGRVAASAQFATKFCHPQAPASIVVATSDGGGGVLADGSGAVDDCCGAFALYVAHYAAETRTPPGYCELRRTLLQLLYDSVTARA